MSDEAFFDAVREITGPLTQIEVDRLNEALHPERGRVHEDAIFDIVEDIVARPLTEDEIDSLDLALNPDTELPPPEENAGVVTRKGALELVGHEGIVLEAYQDSVGIWTWSVGITAAAGLGDPVVYKDNPQTPEVALTAFIELLKKQYLPDVLLAFEGIVLLENELAGALSFHYNTGAIASADWVVSFLAGDYATAREEIMNWSSPPEIIPRREAERDLIFDGVWSTDGYVTAYPVLKPSYTPDWGGAKRVYVGVEKPDDA